MESGDICIWRKSTYTSAFVVLPFRNALEHWSADGRINSGNDQATLGISLVGFWSVYPECTRISVYNKRQSALALVYLRFLGGSTVIFCYYLLRGHTAAPSSLYDSLCHAFLVIIIIITKFFSTIKTGSTHFECENGLAASYNYLVLYWSGGMNQAAFVSEPTVGLSYSYSLLTLDRELLTIALKIKLLSSGTLSQSLNVDHRQCGQLSSTDDHCCSLSQWASTFVYRTIVVMQRVARVPLRQARRVIFLLWV